MSIAYALGRTALNTSTGNQDFSASLGGITPKFAAFRLVRITSDDTPAAPAYYCRGFTDGVTSGCADIAAENGVTTSVGRKAIQGGAATTVDVVRTRRASNTADVSNVDCALRWVSFAADKVTLNVRIAPAGAYLLEFLLIGGTDFTAIVDQFTTSLGAGGSTDRTGLGVPADAALLLHDENNGGNGTAVSCSIVEGYWAATPHSGPAMSGADFGALDNPSVSTADVRDDASKATLVNVNLGRVTLSQIATGYRFSSIDSHNNQVVVAAFNFNKKAVAWVGNLPTATSPAGAQHFTTPRIRPELAICTFSRMQTPNGRASGGDASVHGGGTWTAGAQFGAAVSSKHGVSPTVAKAHWASRFLSIPQEDGTLTSGGSPAAGDAIKATASDEQQGLQLSYSGTSTLARLVPLLVIGPEFVLAPTPADLHLNAPAVVRLQTRTETPTPAAVALNLPAPLRFAAKQPQPVALPLALPAATLFAPPVLNPPAVPDFQPAYLDGILKLLPQGLAWPRRAT